MSDQLALLAAIRDNPEDDTPRLVYADWLDENASRDSDRARAEFIRVQVEQTRTPETDDRQAALEARERRLLIAHGLDWFGEEGLSSFRFRRGFPDCYQGNPATLFPLDTGPLARYPIRELDVGGLFSDGGNFEAGGTAAGDPPPCLARIKALDFSAYRDGLIPLERALAILALPTLTGLREFRLGVRDFGDAGVARIFDSPAVWNVESLDLADQDMTDAGLADFLARPWPRLQRLNLSSNRFTLEGLRRLFASDLWPRLNEIDISCNFERWPDTDALPPAVERSNAERLNLSGLGGMDSPIIGALLRAKSWGPVRNLAINYCKMGLKELQALLVHPSMAGVTDLSLGHNQLTAKAVGLLAAAPALANLTRLDLVDNREAENAVGRLARSRYITRLTYLRASSGAALAEFVSSPNAAHIRRLSPACFATDGLFKAIAASPYMSNLTRLYCNSGKITDRGAAALASSPHLKNLTAIHLLGCKLTEKGIRPLLENESLGWIYGIQFGLGAELWAMYKKRYRGIDWESVLLPDSRLFR